MEGGEIPPIGEHSMFAALYAILKDLSSEFQKENPLFAPDPKVPLKKTFMTGSGKTHGFNRGMKASFFSFAF